MRKELIIITDGKWPVMVIKVDKKRIKRVEKKINNSYNNYYGNEDLRNEFRGYHAYVTTVLNKIKGVELLEFDTLELDPHWR